METGIAGRYDIITLFHIGVILFCSCNIIVPIHFTGLRMLNHLISLSAFTYLSND